MFLRLKNRHRGFTLIELLIVVAIIGLIAAMLIPNMLDALQKAKQKRTMADEKLVGTAAMAWLTDEAGAGAAGQLGVFSLGNYSVITPAAFRDELVPRYIQTIPGEDGWRVPFEYRMNVENPSNTEVVSIRSLGRDARAEGDTYTGGGFHPTDYDRDIVWADGFFVRWPEGAVALSD